jgi:hypothetical protein
MIASIAFILSLFATSGCYLVDLDEDSVLRSVRPQPDSVGLWCYEATNGNRYDISGLNLGSKIDAARGLGTTTVILGILIWVFYLVASCKRFGPGAFKLIGGLCILNSMFQGLVFLVFKSDKICDGDDLGCSLGTGGKCGVSAVVFWFLAGIFSFGAGKEQEEDAPAAPTHDEKAEADEKA